MSRNVICKNIHLFLYKNNESEKEKIMKKVLMNLVIVNYLNGRDWKPTSIWDVEYIENHGVWFKWRGTGISNPVHSGEREEGLPQTTSELVKHLL